MRSLTLFWIPAKGSNKINKKRGTPSDPRFFFQDALAPTANPYGPMSGQVMVATKEQKSAELNRECIPWDAPPTRIPVTTRIIIDIVSRKSQPKPSFAESSEGFHILLFYLKDILGFCRCLWDWKRLIWIFCPNKLAQGFGAWVWYRCVHWWNEYTDNLSMDVSRDIFWNPSMFTQTVWESGVETLGVKGKVQKTILQASKPKNQLLKLYETSMPAKSLWSPVKTPCNSMKFPNICPEDACRYCLLRKGFSRISEAV